MTAPLRFIRVTDPGGNDVAIRADAILSVESLPDRRAVCITLATEEYVTACGETVDTILAALGCTKDGDKP